MIITKSRKTGLRLESVVGCPFSLIRDLLFKNLRKVYEGLLENSNKAFVTTDIEFMHRLLSGMISNQTLRDWRRSISFPVDCLTSSKLSSITIPTANCSSATGRAHGR